MLADIYSLLTEKTQLHHNMNAMLPKGTDYYLVIWIFVTKRFSQRLCAKGLRCVKGVHYLCGNSLLSFSSVWRLEVMFVIENCLLLICLSVQVRSGEVMYP